MKKFLSMLLALVLFTAVLSGCTTLEKDAEGNTDRGAVINMYIATETFNFDPQLAINDEAMLKVMSLLYEGLTTIGSNGKWEYAMMDNYEVTPEDRDGYSILINLKESKWTDGRTVQAGDFVYSWKRLLDANTKGEASSLLYDIKNARAINAGDISVDDLGVSAVDTYTIKVTFENENVDLDRFFTNMSALALVPLREDVITRYGENWAKRATSITTNGPFSLKQIPNEEDGTFRIERCGYYYRDTEANENLDKYVIPYRLITVYDTDTVADQLERFENEEIFYIGEIPLESREEYEDDAEIEDMMSTHTYVFNTQNPLFAKKEVRQALSIAIDREAIAEILVYADPAVGYIPNGVFNTKAKTSFREESEDLINTSADIDAAKSLLKSAGVTSGSFSITVRNNETDLAVAEYVKGVWEDLGFRVSIDIPKNSILTKTETEGTFDYVIDEFQRKYTESDFDVIAIDMTMITPDAFSALSQFNPAFSGNGTNMDTEEYPLYAHVSGYESEEYNQIIEDSFAAVDKDERAELLHKAEELLLEDMPVCPLVFLKSAYLSSNILSGFDTTYNGTTDFKRVKMKNYMDYKETEEVEDNFEADEEE